ncbi:MAG: preprotein translocase subunit SecY, partial [Planctomycetes bacterium]|nr:preprotein translocase subunit SecY [Planctomycetota bacterium]
MPGRTPSEIFSSLYTVPQLRKRFVFTIFALIVYRVGFAIPVPGIDSVRFAKALEDVLGDSWAAGLLGIYNTLSAGAIMDFTIFSLGIMPYISSEIIFQLLTKVVPSLEELSKEGEQGRRKLKQYSRFLTIAICIVQAAFVCSLMLNDPKLSGTMTSEFSGQEVMFYLSTILTMTAGTFFLIFLGDKITEKGIGNGVSLIIQAGILASIPQTVLKLAGPMFDSKSSPSEAVEAFVALLLLIAMFVTITYGIVQITLGRREIPIQHQKHARSTGGGARRQTIPLRVDQAGVIPIIFASALLVFPTLFFGQIGRWLSTELTADSSWTFVRIICEDIEDAFNGFGWMYEMCYVGLIVFFTYFWTQLTFSPTELSKNMREWGAYIPGVRPGADTVAYLTTVLKRMTLAGATFLSLVAIVPNLFPHIASAVFGDSQALTENRLFFRIIGGTGLLIVVSVALDLVQRVEAELVT